VRTGPRIQLKIAKTQFELNSRQIDLQQQTLAHQRRQLRANLLGAAEQKWIDAFRDALSEFDASANEFRSLVAIDQENAEAQKFEPRQFDLAVRALSLITKITLLLGSTDPVGVEFVAELRKVFKLGDPDQVASVRSGFFVMADKIIAEREKKVAMLTGTEDDAC
jgi:hypothetical protein